ncbi:hypothetical protein JOC55_005264 [Paenibacillus sacheonensis]|nr:hypothetical protein [Paenibacillus sacheonensis]
MTNDLIGLVFVGNAITWVDWNGDIPIGICCGNSVGISCYIFIDFAARISAGIYAGISVGNSLGSITGNFIGHRTREGMVNEIIAYVIHTVDLTNGGRLVRV